MDSNKLNVKYISMQKLFSSIKKVLFDSILRQLIQLTKAAAGNNNNN